MFCIQNFKICFPCSILYPPKRNPNNNDDTNNKNNNNDNNNNKAKNQKIKKKSKHYPLKLKQIAVPNLREEGYV